MLKISVLFWRKEVYTELTLKFQMCKLLVNSLGPQFQLVTFSSSEPNEPSRLGSRTWKRCSLAVYSENKNKTMPRTERSSQAGKEEKENDTTQHKTKQKKLETKHQAPPELVFFFWSSVERASTLFPITLRPH